MPEVIADTSVIQYLYLSTYISVNIYLGILLRAKRSQLIDKIAPVMDRLNQLGFRASDATQLTVLKLAGEVAQ